jgi:hypothetical protein
MAAALELADISCTQARSQLGGLWPQLAGAPEPDYAGMSRRVLSGESLDLLPGDVAKDRALSESADEGTNR